VTTLIFGCGYVGYRVGQRWRARGDEVWAVTRSAERASELARAGLRPIVGDVMDAASLGNLPAAETVLLAVAHDRGSGRTVREVYVEGLKNVLRGLPVETARVIYISSTGVYGQTHGEWVDEDSPCAPQREGGRACLEAEQHLRDHALGQRSVILRMAGIYGPSRVPYLKLMAAGQAIPEVGDGYLNLIHVDDATSAVVLAGSAAVTPSLYCISDGQPVPRGEFYREVARRIGAPPPTFVSPPRDSPAARRASTNKRVSNRRVQSELGLRLDYPSYKEGLSAIRFDEP
jgi:nucleoside-diphosphate-sugar epimerase